MNHYLKLLVFSGSLFIFSIYSQDSSEMVSALKKCESYQVKSKHPVIAKFEIEHKVHGRVDGKCKYTQTMPNNGLMTCLYLDSDLSKLTGNKQDTAIMKQRCKISGYGPEDIPFSDE